MNGLVKLLHPDLEVREEALEEYLKLAMEMRRRVKQQLKKMGGIEFWDTRFVYFRVRDGIEIEVPVPEMGAGGLIPEEALPPGVVFTISSDPATGKTGIFRIEAAVNKGSSGYAVTGLTNKAARGATKIAYDYLVGNWSKLAVEKSITDYQINIQIVPLQSVEELEPSSTAIAVGIVSRLLDRGLRPGTVIVGNITLQGAVLPVVGLAECLQAATEQGAKRVLIPMPNLKEVAEIPTEIVKGLELVFYTDPLDVILKAIKE